MGTNVFAPDDSARAVNDERIRWCGREICRVLKPGGRLVVIAEVYKGANTTVARLAAKYASKTGMTLLDIDEHRALLTNAGYSEVQIIEECDKGWMCGIGRKP